MFLFDWDHRGEDRAQHRRLFENVSDAVMVFEATTGRVLEVNNAGVGLYGYSREEFLKLRVTDLSEEPLDTVATFKGLIEGEVVEPPLRLHRRRDGTLFCAQIRASAVSGAGCPVVVGFVKKPPESQQVEEEHYRLLFERNVAGVFRSTINGEMLDCNESFARMFGCSSRTQAVAGGTAVLYDDPEVRQRLMDELVREGAVSAWEQPMRRRDGERVWALVSATLIESDDGGESVIEGSVIDLTERRRLEDRLAQVQKLEAIGQLAGGIAHDFNNLLMAISASADALAFCASDSTTREEDLMNIHRTVERGAELTRRLLAIGRGQMLEMEAVDLGRFVDQELDMLRRVIPENIGIFFSAPEELRPVMADRGQLAQVLLNLVLNARDAMPDGGTLELETTEIVLDSNDTVARPGVAEGAYVRLTVADSGSGMRASILSRIFEPFFTTKEEGRGSGLGLATVYGIVTQHGGFIEVASEPGVGTTFDVYLGITHEQVGPSPTNQPISFIGGNETILLAEDDDGVRRIIARILEELGYVVIEARDGVEALREIERSEDAIDLVICDLIMPRMGGHELLARSRQSASDIPFLFSSGYTDRALGDELTHQASVSFIAKPFRMEQIATKVREMLANSRR